MAIEYLAAVPECARRYEVKFSPRPKDETENSSRSMTAYGTLCWVIVARGPAMQHRLQEQCR